MAKRTYIKNRQVKAITVRIDEDESIRYHQIYGTHTTGAEIAVRVFLYMRKFALEEVKKLITEDQFASINELVDIELLGPKTIYDKNIMLIAMKNKYDAVGGYSFSFKQIEKAVLDLTPERVVFLFQEVFRFRRYLDEVPNYNPREFYNEEMK